MSGSVIYLLRFKSLDRTACGYLERFSSILSHSARTDTQTQTHAHTHTLMFDALHTDLTGLNCTYIHKQTNSLKSKRTQALEMCHTKYKHTQRHKRRRGQPHKVVISVSYFLIRVCFPRRRVFSGAAFGSQSSSSPLIPGPRPLMCSLHLVQYTQANKSAAGSVMRSSDPHHHGCFKASLGLGCKCQYWTRKAPCQFSVVGDK